MSQVVILGPLKPICTTYDYAVFEADGKKILLDITRIARALYDNREYYYIMYEANNEEVNNYREYMIQELPKNLYYNLYYVGLGDYDIFGYYRKITEYCTSREELQIKEAFFVLRLIGVRKRCGKFKKWIRELLEWDYYSIARFVSDPDNYKKQECKYLAAVVLLYIESYNIEYSTQDAYTAENLRIVEERLSKFAESKDPMVFRDIYNELLV